MMTNYYKYLIFTPMLLVTNLMIFSTSSWLAMWMIMEMNLINFIMLIKFDSPNNSNIFMSYFLIQTLNSYLFLFSSIMLDFNHMFEYFMMLTLITKMGMPPFHYWYFNMFYNLKWFNIFLISTIQKLIPFMIITNLLNLNFSMYCDWLMGIMILSSMIYSIVAIDYLNIKLIMAYSSIIQVSWMILILVFNEKLWLLYFSCYFLIMMNICILCNKMNLNQISNISSSMINNKTNMFIFMNLMSLAAIPPYFGFMMKWNSIMMLNNQLNYIIIMTMIWSSLTSAYFYIRLMFYSILKNKFKTKIYLLKLMKKTHFSFWFIYLNWLILIMLLNYELL
nr:NADH dehydrogenase subunit 2 [Merostenus sp.]